MTTFGIEGHPDQRTSKTRIYTHAIVGSFSAKKAVDRRWDDVVRSAKRDFAYYAANAEGDCPISHRDIAAAGVDSFVASAIERLRAWAHNASGTYVLQWSLNEKNALKAVGTWQKRHYDNVHVVPCFPTKHSPGAPTVAERVTGW